MTSAQVNETSIINNSSFDNCTQQDAHSSQTMKSNKPKYTCNAI